MKRANNSRIIVQNLKTMAVVQLNVLATGQDFAIDNSQIIEVIPINSAADSTLVYEELGRVQKIDVDETASAIATASGTVFSVTAYLSGSSGSTVTRYLSAVKCKQLIEFTSYRAIEYNNAGVELLTINVSDSLATLIAAINVSSSDFVTIAGTQTVTGAKTFSALTIVSNTTQSTDSATGALTTLGGLGVAKNLFIGGVYGGKANVLASSGNTTMTAAMSGATMLIDGATVAYALPAIGASDVGMFFDFVVTVAATAASITAGAADLLTGGIILIDDTAAYTAPQAVVAKPDVTNDLILSMNGTTTGGKIGSKFRFTAVSATRWYVEGVSCGSGVLATPFS